MFTTSSPREPQPCFSPVSLKRLLAYCTKASWRCHWCLPASEVTAPNLWTSPICSTLFKWRAPSLRCPQASLSLRWWSLFRSSARPSHSTSCWTETWPSCSWVTASEGWWTRGTSKGSPTLKSSLKFWLLKSTRRLAASWQCWTCSLSSEWGDGITLWRNHQG